MPRFQKDSMVDQKWPEVPKYKQPNLHLGCCIMFHKSNQTYWLEYSQFTKFI